MLHHHHGLFPTIWPATSCQLPPLVHGNIRLGRTSLLDCVEIDRETGVACNKFMLGGKEKRTSLALLSGGGLSGNVEDSKLASGSDEDTMHTSFKASSGLTVDEVAKQTKNGDVWDPGGELAILISAGKDATAEFDKIHTTDVIEDDDTPDATIGTLGAGDVDDDEEDDAAEGGYSLDEVANHTMKGDVWGVLHGRVLNVSNFLSRHPGTELALSTCTGKDATAELDVEKYAPDTIIGTLGGGDVDDDEEDGSAAGGYTTKR